MKQKLVAFLLALVICLMPCAAMAAQEDLLQERETLCYVEDAAGLLTQEEIDELQDQIDSLNADIKKQYSDMKLRIQYMYENGDKQIISVLLTSDNISDFLFNFGTSYI